MHSRGVSTCLVVCLLLALFGCSGEDPLIRPTEPTVLASITSGSTYYVSNQSEFDSALASVSSGDTIILTTWHAYAMPSGCFSGGSSCLDGVRLEADHGAILDFYGVASSPTFSDASWEDITLRWSPTYLDESVTFVNSDITNILTQRGSLCDGCAPVVCEEDVSVTDCVNIKLAVDTDATVDVYGTTTFLGATSECDDGYSTVETGGDLRVHGWRYGGTTYGAYDPLITSTDVIAMSGCMWGYIRVGVADSNADVGTIYYGDDDCTEYQTSTTVVGGYHYASVRIDYFTDGDFYWKADIGYCSDNDWGQESTSCTRVRKSKGIIGCPEPGWWPW